ncbi:ABC transporter ATP-binding protein [Actomonas aquatica]|uniref:ABC transporter ATP-binding protein n=1 Tax=Actomonas aquatica TaxID=2866162 RepID=A0ABZ1CDG5_9BACT|nr:ABC transporter ATP-binding protein [Opitutus sp. WL0086]WRQ89728.1 ABC transporter ATP-binding protein [Opitutus sp. WL0086]
MKALELKDVGVAGRLQPLDLSVEAGQLVGLVGPNGSGKSTLLSAAAGLLPASGQVCWQERKLDELAVMERGRMAAWVPQEAHFSFGFTVRSVVAQGRFAHGDDGNGVEEALQRLDLMELADRPVDRLSGGERHRVMLARALAVRPRLHFWDEPLAALDVRHALEVLVLARELADQGAAVLLSLHDLRVAHCLDQVVMLDRGQLRAKGPPAEVLSAGHLEHVFGVKLRTAPGMILELP